ncbi:MAG: hypothetical protein KDD60_09920 [Bdellovibrionales bacterium]|nr:hypothetical protein [Bdellovibrionales bacterium]
MAPDRKFTRRLVEYLLGLDENSTRNNSSQFGSTLQELVPILGASKSFMTALQRYCKARLQEDSLEIQRSREAGLAAIFDLLIDFSFLSPFIARIARMQTVVKLTKTIGKVSAIAYLSRLLRRNKSSSATQDSTRDYNATTPEVRSDWYDLSTSLAHFLLERQEMQSIMDSVFEKARKTLVTVVLS